MCFEDEWSGGFLSFNFVLGEERFFGEGLFFLYFFLFKPAFLRIVSGDSVKSNSVLLYIYSISNSSCYLFNSSCSSKSLLCSSRARRAD